MSTPKFCPACGQPLAVGAKFCAECGKPIIAAAAAQAEKHAPAPAESKPEPKPEPKAEAKPAAREAQLPAASDDDAPHHRSHASHSGGHFDDPMATILDGKDDDHHSDDLGPPDPSESVKTKRPVPVGLIALLLFVVFLGGLMTYVFGDEERSAAIQCRVLGRKDKCETDADKRFALEQQEKREENDLMGHHYGFFDLSVGPDDAAALLRLTIVQKRYEETRKDFVGRIRDGGDDKRAAKDTKTGAYIPGKSADGQAKGAIAFTGQPGSLTWEPKPGQKLLMPLTLQNLPLLEKEQTDGTGKRLTAADVERVSKELENLPRDEDGHVIYDDAHKIRTSDLSSWIYEIYLEAPGYKGRKVLFYEHPGPPDVNLKQLETQGWTVRKFKRAPDGRWVIDNAAFDLLEEPLTIRGRYLRVLKELHCVRQTADYKGKSDQGKKDAEDLIWEQLAMTRERREVAEANDKLETYSDPKTWAGIESTTPTTGPAPPPPPFTSAQAALDGWKAHVAAEIKAYECPKPEPQ
jgi:hypothetical protein